MANVKQDETFERVERSISEFYQAMKLREEMSIRIGKRTTYITRFTMLLVAILGLVMFYLVSSLNSQIKVMSQQMMVMTEYMDDMRTDMHTLPSINHHMINISGHMGDVHHEMNRVATSVRFMNEHMSVMPSMRANIAGMDNEISSLNKKIGTMNYQFSDINRSVGRMNYDVNRMAKPMSRIPFFSW